LSSEPPPQADPPSPPQRRTARLPAVRGFELLIGAGVLLISLISLFVAVSANRTQERLLAASVWPSLIFGTSNASPEGVPQISFDLLNRGTGPARVRWAELQYDGVPMRDRGMLLARCCGQFPESTGQQYHVVTSGIQRRVLGADEWVALLRAPRPDPPMPAWEALDRERHKIRLRACYCSVLDDCWLLDSERDDDPEPVRQCPRAPAVLWGG
jgi:hypothetical protein